MVDQNYLPQKFIFSADLGHFILKIHKIENYFHTILKKCKIFAKTGGDYPLRPEDWGDEIPSIPPVAPPMGMTFGFGISLSTRRPRVFLTCRVTCDLTCRRDLT